MISIIHKGIINFMRKRSYSNVTFATNFSDFMTLNPDICEYSKLFNKLHSVSMPSSRKKKMFAFLTSGQLAMFCFFATHRSSMKLQVFMQSTDVWLIIQGNEKRAAATKLVIFLLFSYFQKSNELLTQQTPFFLLQSTIIIKWPKNMID